jgi:hypothetical protein
VASSRNTAPSFGRATGDLWRAVASDLLNTYHPERHYMRGPGPKWRAKHALGQRIGNVGHEEREVALPEAVLERA